VVPSSLPSTEPSSVPSGKPSSEFSAAPSSVPSGQPSSLPSAQPSGMPSVVRSYVPSLLPSIVPSVIPSTEPSILPSSYSSLSPSVGFSLVPSILPSTGPSSLSSGQPTYIASSVPSVLISSEPSSVPSLFFSVFPSSVPSLVLSVSPSSAPTPFPSFKSCNVSISEESTAAETITNFDTNITSYYSNLEYISDPGLRNVTLSIIDSVEVLRIQFIKTVNCTVNEMTANRKLLDEASASVEVIESAGALFNSVSLVLDVLSDFYDTDSFNETLASQQEIFDSLVEDANLLLDNFSRSPSSIPSLLPSVFQSSLPSGVLSNSPSYNPTTVFSSLPSSKPSEEPSKCERKCLKMICFNECKTTVGNEDDCLLECSSDPVNRSTCNFGCNECKGCVDSCKGGLDTNECSKCIDKKCPEYSPTSVPTTYPSSAPTTGAPTQRVVCDGFNRAQCDEYDTCAFGPRNLKKCSPKEAFEFDCSSLKREDRCNSNSKCTFQDGNCLHNCDIFDTGADCSAITEDGGERKICSFTKESNPCYGCKHITCPLPYIFPSSAPTFTSAPTPQVACEGFNRNKCALYNTCAYGPRNLKKCFPKEGFEFDCASLLREDRCNENSKCAFVDNSCIHNCHVVDSAMDCSDITENGNDRKICSFTKESNPCAGCNHITCS